jgi:O-antigen/teichoic acid export membrane protein
MKNKIMKINQLKAGTILSYISMGVGYLVSFIYTPIMLRLLGQSEYGLYNLVASIVAYLGILNFGFDSAYMRYYTRYIVKEDQKKIAALNGMFLIIFSFIGIVAVIAGTILAFNTEFVLGSGLTSIELSRAKILFLILVLNLAISFPNIVFISHISANEKFIFQRIVQMIRTIIHPFVAIPILLAGYGSIGMVVVTTILNVVFTTINAYYCVNKLKMNFSFQSFDLRLMKEMTIFSSYIFINIIVDQINWNVDKFILGRFHGTTSVALYGLASSLNIYFLSISVGISSVFIPRVHRLVASSKDNNALTSLFIRIGRIQFIVLTLFSTGLIFFGRPFINIWAGNNYDKSFFIALLLIIPGTLSSAMQNIGIEIQRAKNMHKFRSWLYFAIALGNIGITIPLARTYGGVGAAFGTALAIIIGNGFIMNWYYHVKVGLDIKLFWRQIFSFTPSLIAPIMVGVLFNILFDLNKLINLLSFGIIYVVLFCASLWFFGMNQYEKDLLGKPVKRIIRKI